MPPSTPISRNQWQVGATNLKRGQDFFPPRQEKANSPTPSCFIHLVCNDSWNSDVGPTKFWPSRLFKRFGSFSCDQGIGMPLAGQFDENLVFSRFLYEHANPIFGATARCNLWKGGEPDGFACHDRTASRPIRSQRHGFHFRWKRGHQRHLFPSCLSRIMNVDCIGKFLADTHRV